MTFIQYLSTKPFITTCLTLILVFDILFTIMGVKSITKRSKEGTIFSLVSLNFCIGMQLVFLVIGYLGYNNGVQKAINDNYTVYIDGERSFSTSPKEALLDNEHFYSHIDTTNGWVLCESKTENQDTVKYFDKYNKEVPN